MDVIEGLPYSSVVDVILVVMDQLTKYAYFIGLKHPYTTMTMAQVYIDQVLSSMVHLFLLSMIGILCLLVHFGKSCSRFKG